MEMTAPERARSQLNETVTTILDVAREHQGTCLNDRQKSLRLGKLPAVQEAVAKLHKAICAITLEDAITEFRQVEEVARGYLKKRETDLTTYEHDQRATTRKVAREFNELDARLSDAILTSPDPEFADYDLTANSVGLSRGETWARAHRPITYGMQNVMKTFRGPLHYLEQRGLLDEHGQWLLDVMDQFEDIVLDPAMDKELGQERNIQSTQLLISTTLFSDKYAELKPAGDPRTVERYLSAITDGNTARLSGLTSS